MEVVRRIEDDAEWKMLTGEEKAAMASMTRQYYQKLKAEIEDPKHTDLSTSDRSPQTDSIIPESDDVPETDDADDDEIQDLRHPNM